MPIEEEGLAIVVGRSGKGKGKRKRRKGRRGGRGKGRKEWGVYNIGKDYDGHVDVETDVAIAGNMEKGEDRA
jgi:hypothetical protein